MLALVISWVDGEKLKEGHPGSGVSSRCGWSLLVVWVEGGLMSQVGSEDTGEEVPCMIALCLPQLVSAGQLDHSAYRYRGR